MSNLRSTFRSSTIDQSKFEHLLSLYADVLQSFYKVKVKGDEKKRREALEDDEWRYQQLPSELKQKEEGSGLSKGELERLVKWKITHQINRPFLLPQIRKNDPEVVKKCTSDAHHILLRSSGSSKATDPSSLSRETILKALAKVCELTGVGPATGTLVLSVFNNQDVPFFEDELHAWLLPDHNAKLKYNVKEYSEMLEKFDEATSSGLEVKSSSTGLAEAFEKVAFVCEHWDHVAEDKKTSQNTEKVLDDEENNTRVKRRDNSVAEKPPTTKTLKVHKTPGSKTTGDKRGISEIAEPPTNVRRSKRNKV